MIEKHISNLKKWEHLVFICLQGFYIFLSSQIFLQNRQSMLLIALLLFALALMWINHALRKKFNRYFRWLIPLLLSFSIIYVDLLAVNSDFKIVILIVVASIINDGEMSFALAFMGIPLVTYLTASALKISFGDNPVDFPDLVAYIIRNAVTYLLVSLSFYMAKRHIFLSRQLHEMVDELKESRERLKELSVAEERTRIAREIHDTLGHSLTGALIQLEAAKGLRDVDSDKAFEAIERAQEITRSGFQELKRAIRTLRPIAIEDHSLDEALNLYAKRIAERHNFTVFTDFQIPPDLPDNIKTESYKIIMEIINNSIKHSGKTEMSLSLSHRENRMYIYCFDRGHCCKTINEGFGLKGIRERIQKLSGQVSFSLHETEGFQTLASIPLY